MAYEQMILGGMDKIEAEKHLNEVLVANERGNAKEFVMHGSTLSIVDMIKRNVRSLKNKYKIQQSKYHGFQKMISHIH